MTSDGDSTDKARERLLEMAKLLNDSAMKWEELRIKVALTAIGLVGAIIAFVLGRESILQAGPLLKIAAILIMTTSALAYFLTGRYTQSHYRTSARARAFREAWLRGRDLAYVDRKYAAALARPIWLYYVRLWPLGQLVLFFIGLLLFAFGKDLIFYPAL